MTRTTLTFLALATSLAAGCRDSGGTFVVLKDMTGSAPVDLAGDLAGQVIPDLTATPGDLSAPADTIHDLIANATNGQKLRVVDVVVTGVPRYSSTSSRGFCQYEAYVQDKAGQAPNGVRLYMKGGMATVTDGGATRCPFPPTSGTLLDNFADLGDVLTITGSWGIFSPVTDGGLLPGQHEIDVTSGTIVKTGSGATVTPVVITDTTPFVKFADGFVKYENTLVTIKPGAPGVVSAYDNFGNYLFGGAQFRGDYRFVYNKADGGTFPANGLTFSTITGIALLPFGGGVAARTMADFVP